jgi:hypothetical protein
MKLVLCTIAAFGAIFSVSAESMDLASFPDKLISAPGWTWEGFADTVMGGNSDLQTPSIVNTPDGPALRLAGEVVTKGGGFIQVRLQHDDGIFDASGFSGVEVELQAPAGGSYYLFARTRDNTFPWSYFGAYIDVPEKRSILQIPWSAFKGENSLRRNIRPELLRSVALVAAYKDFQSDLHIYRVSFY